MMDFFGKGGLNKLISLIKSKFDDMQKEDIQYIDDIEIWNSMSDEEKAAGNFAVPSDGGDISADLVMKNVDVYIHGKKAGGSFNDASQIKFKSDVYDSTNVQDALTEAWSNNHTLDIKLDEVYGFAGHNREAVGSNLNDLNYPGVYFCRDCSNSPTTESFTLTVFCGGTGTVSQHIVTNATNKYYIRNFNGSIWSEWFEIAKQNDISAVTESLTQISELETVQINVSGITPSSSAVGVHKKNGICYISAYVVASSATITFSSIPKPYSGVYGIVADTNNSKSSLAYIAGNVDNFSLGNLTPGNTYFFTLSYPHR